MRPLLEVFIISWNEEKIISDIIGWYRDRVPGCLITLMDNESTDNTVKIAEQMGCNVTYFSSNNQMDELTLMNVRNTCWKGSEAEYIIVCDADEWVDVNRDILLRNNEEKEWDICKCFGYEMFGYEHDTPNTLVMGTWSAGYCKPILFKKDKVLETNFEAGSHKCNARGEEELKWKINFPNLYHTKHRSWSNVIDRCALLAARRSQDSKNRGWNFHYSLPESAHKDYRENGLKNSIKVR